MDYENICIKQEIDCKSSVPVDANKLLQDELHVKPLSDSDSNESKGERLKEKNRIRQLAFKARENMLKNYKSFCLVAEHLVCNAHCYYKEEVGNVLKMEGKVKTDCVEKEGVCELDFTQANKHLREIRVLKQQNRVCKQQERVQKLMSKVMYRELSKMTGIPLKALHDWCSDPKEILHKSTDCANSKKEVLNFLMQDSITYSHPCKRYAGKKFLLHTLDEVYNRYTQQTQFHKHGKISKIALRLYKPKYILLAGKTPVNQCLCD